jgi:predicted O-linked N-acetylglucosamine transferase (SPINDLY family)
LRLGLISPLFCCSPVYFFCYGSLALLAEEFDLVFLNRGAKRDWAQAKFRAIAREWFDVQALGPDALAAFVRSQQLDVLLDLGGWMDNAALRALSTKPAHRLYKWVGGQSATTGLKVYDGMLSDRYQSPRALQKLYTEPLVLLRSGYVTYCAPDYMPAPRGAQGRALGVIANPVKVSRVFLDDLGARLRATTKPRRPLALRFIDRRYRHARARARIEAALAALPAHITVEFLTPEDHPAYLAQVAALDAVIDTFPYTGGLTAIEALAMGVPCVTRAGTLFSERHSHAHARYAGMDLALADWDNADLGAYLKSAGKSRQSLISGRSKRVDHTALARELANLFWRQ